MVILSHRVVTRVTVDLARDRVKETLGLLVVLRRCESKSNSIFYAIIYEYSISYFISFSVPTTTTTSGLTLHKSAMKIIFNIIYSIFIYSFKFAIVCGDTKSPGSHKDDIMNDIMTV